MSEDRRTADIAEILDRVQAPVQPPGSAGREPRDSAASGTDAAGGARVLVVDDEPLARQMLTDLLEAHGFEAVSVARGEEAFGWLDEVDLVLLDAMLPGRDGWSICREIKQDHDPLLPIIMVTARTSPEDVVRTFESGADDYVAKPFHVAELTARIATRLRVHRAERALQDVNHRLADLAKQNYELYDRARRDAEERQLLLRELDHRVRNNLSVILGLVGMERNRRPPRQSGEALKSLEDRLRSFLLVHKALRRQSYHGVPLREITERLAQRLRNAMDPEGRIQVDVSGESDPLDEKQGFALALVLNELVTNALKHAFPDRDGRIDIHIEQTDGTVCLEVRDDGVGMSPPEERADDAAVLGSGTTIMDALVNGEIGGRLEYVSTGRGTHARLTFPIDPPESDPEFEDA